MHIYESKTDRQERIPHFRQSYIRNARVAVLGAGADGNEVLKCLALTGFGGLFIADMDVIAKSNLSRTVLFHDDDVGKSKVAVAAERYRQLCTEDARVDTYDGDICHGLGEGVLRHVDLVIGCVDNDQTRLFVSNICMLLGKPYIDTAIGGFNWNVFTSSGKSDCSCYACIMSPRQERAALNRIRNSCDVTKRIAASEDLVPTINIAASSAGALAVQEAIKICHHLSDANSGLPAPRFGWMSSFTAEKNELRNTRYLVRSDCEHHDNYKNHGGVHETPMSARWKLKDALNWAREHYGREYAICLYKDNVCAERSFITTACCKSCGIGLDVYRPQPLTDRDLLCKECRAAGKYPQMPSGAVRKNTFDLTDEPRLLDLSLLELGVPLLHIVEFTPLDEGDSLYLELTGDLHEVMPNLTRND